MSTPSVQSKRVVKAACPLDCPDTCTMLVTVEDGVATSVKGDPTHPMTAGHLCSKMNHYQEKVYNPDRILYPLKRVGPKGEGQFARITWDEALDEIAEKFKSITSEYGSQAILPYSYLGTQGILNGLTVGDAFFHKLGASVSERTFCDSGATSAYDFTLGPAVGLDPESMVHSKYIIVWGANLLSNNLHQWKFMTEARKRGAKIVVIDPVHTKTAAQADWHIALRPGTDSALALGMMNVIINENLIDVDYVENYTVGYPELKERSQQFPPSRVAEITGLPEATILQLAREYATSQPAAIRVGVGMERNRNGGQSMRAIASLPALVGAFRKPGGGILQLSLYNFPLRWDRMLRPDMIKPGTRVLNQWRLGKVLAGELEGPPVKALVVYNSNPAVSTADQGGVLRGLAREDLFTVVSEQFMTDTARYADLILPAASQLEQLDIMFSWGHHYLTLNQPAIAPMGEAVPNTELFRRLAERMGFDDDCFKLTDEEMVGLFLEWSAPQLQGITMESLKETGFARLNLPHPDEYAPFAEGGFPTPSGKVELYSSEAAKGNMVSILFREGYNEFQPGEPLDPLPNYRESAEAHLKDKYPLNMISPKSHAFINSSFGNFDRQRRIVGEPHIVLHPNDADKRSIQDGQKVRMFNSRGSMEVVAKVNDTVLPGVVVAPVGYWASLSNSPTSNALTALEYADFGRAPTFSDTQVEVESVR
ncbi:molybdopterin-containing oxidoreductase family protein [Paenibacillus silvae]|uniref:molybdopterin-containing oxidoreductase family protein n=1 Tax=Paenibacillus silvae TaxID=1325358 RepID=UPI00249E1B55|nr:molybdopterin-dependent oxidoreductase [Paenibacillus silvae]MCK6076658.1 molybdopterin-dependent oxidoreductase [Paenibacillus silvae]MCK6151085.1 molybdopterin-dependent oxidoreductase [Paenibacillus silvae]MCK6269344.1 molybdopterin-dependent oxidoreductase [Paenibacillus silvae]